RSDDAQRLRIVIEAAGAGETAVERALAGMAERRGAAGVRERQRLAPNFVKPQRAGKRTGGLPGLQGGGGAGGGNGGPPGRRTPWLWGPTAGKGLKGRARAQPGGKAGGAGGGGPPPGRPAPPAGAGGKGPLSFPSISALPLTAAACALNYRS